jgi:2',3'-cyclic-nucleotide 2'-phosphodiesterase (5'-nucleotidase family)
MSASTHNAAARQRRLPIVTLFAAFAIALLGLSTPAAAAEMTFIHMGDVHGHMVPRPSLYAKTPGATEGGLARMMTAINEIRTRRTRSKTLLINTGDTIQGSAEALFASTNTLVTEVGHDGQAIGELNLTVTNEHLSGCRPHARPATRGAEG